MFLHLAVLSYCSMTFIGARSPPSIMARIIGGSDIPIEKVPNQVALYIDDLFSCGGSLLTKQCVLTAAHCVLGQRIESLQIRAGITHITRDPGERRRVDKAVLPSTLVLNPIWIDVAILRLNASVCGPNIAPVQLSNRELRAGDLVNVSGWGLITKDRPILSNELRVVTVEVFSRKLCRKRYGSEMADTMFCAGAPGGGKDSCAGDSGGPVMMNGKQVGIVSWGHGCAEAEYPGVYISIKHVLDWVNLVKFVYCEK